MTKGLAAYIFIFMLFTSISTQGTKVKKTVNDAGTENPANVNSSSTKNNDVKAKTGPPEAKTMPIIQIGCVGRPDARCVRCLQDTSLCSFCADGFYPSRGSCVLKKKTLSCGEKKIDYCLTCDGEKCKTCLIGFSLVNSECVSCMVKGCDVCNSSLVCHTCKFGHELTASGTCRNTGAGSSTNNERLPKKDARRLFNY